MSDGNRCCPKYQRAADLLCRRWTTLIVRALLPGPRRFTEMTEAIPGLSDRLLSQRLKELESAGIVTRRVYPVVPVRVEYTLTAKGYDLERLLAELQCWADRWEHESALPAAVLAGGELFFPGAG